MPLISTLGAMSSRGFGEFNQQAGPVYIEDVFSTYLYTGNGSTQTVPNGIDLSGKGGLVWMKVRSGTTDHALYDTARGSTQQLVANLANGQSTQSTGLTSFSASGFSIGALATINTNAAIYVSWTFRKQTKFFDVVTYTGNGANRTISHNLGSVPGMIIVKRTNTTGDWQVYHRSLANTEYLVLNTSAAKATGTTRWNSTTPTSTVFSLGTDATVNASGGTYVAYLFAHNAGGFGVDGSQNVISCDSFTTDGSGNATVNLGWEPQYVFIKRTDTTGDWNINDIMQGFVGTSSGGGVYLLANGSDNEGAWGAYGPIVTSTGFYVLPGSLGINGTYIYMAIRRGPMKVPTDATKVFMPTVYTGTNVSNRLVNTTIAPDMIWARQRDSTSLTGMLIGDRLRGQPYMLTGSSATEVTSATALDQQIVSSVEWGTAFSSMNGVWVGNDATAQLNASTTASNQIMEGFKRAPGFFDAVAYTGNGTARTINHNLGVVPEFMVVKIRNPFGNSWHVYSSSLGPNFYLRFEASGGSASASAAIWNSTSPTASVFSVGAGAGVNGGTWTYIAYLFATCPGVSKVGSYTGTGTTQQINCGFTSGARFVLIKRTDTNGGWYVYDTARGIVAANDPYILLNSTAAEVTNTDYVDTYSAGFELSSTAPADLNANGGSYIFLAIA